MPELAKECVINYDRASNRRHLHIVYQDRFLAKVLEPGAEGNKSVPVFFCGKKEGGLVEVGAFTFTE